MPDVDHLPGGSPERKLKEQIPQAMTFTAAEIETALTWQRRTNVDYVQKRDIICGVIKRYDLRDSYDGICEIIIRTHLKDLTDKFEAMRENRDLFCGAINTIGRDIVGPRINAFQHDNCSAEAVVRETRNLIEKLETEIREYTEHDDS